MLDIVLGLHAIYGTYFTSLCNCSNYSRRMLVSPTTNYSASTDSIVCFVWNTENLMVKHVNESDHKCRNEKTQCNGPRLPANNTERKEAHCNT